MRLYARLARPVLGASVVLGSLVGTRARADERWPLWPTEVEVVAAPLRSGASVGPPTRVAPESVRLDALTKLEDYPEVLILDDLLLAIGDRSSTVKRAALQQCIARVLHSCIPRAVEIWNDSSVDASVRMYALELMLLDPSDAHVEALLIALQDPTEQLRNAATSLAGKVVLPQASQERVRSALIAKLGDATPHIRASAARSLGRLGPGRGALAISRLLQDPDPNVRRWAATALGQFADARAVPALMRAVEAGDEAYVSRALLHGLGLLPGVEVDRMLLQLLDDQPRGLAMSNVVEAIGLREQPSPELLDGLLVRLRETHLRESIVAALQMLGERARTGLERAVARGLDPELALEAERLLAALDLPTEPEPVAFERPEPKTTTLAGWRKRLRVPDIARRLRAAGELVVFNPPWLAAAIVREIDQSSTPDPIRGWIAALALGDAALDGAADTLGGGMLWARLGRWGRDRRLSTDDRCLAIAALGAAAAAPRKRRHRVIKDVTELAGSTSREIRSCAALTLGRLHAPAALEALLHDSSPRVRASAALGVAILRASAQQRSARDPLRDSLSTRLAVLAVEDEHIGVRLAARLANAAPTSDPAPPSEELSWLIWDDRPLPSNTAWRPAIIAGQEVLVPTRDFGGVSWTHLPGLAASAVELPDPGVPSQNLAALLIRFITD
ncbi:MAG: HEAT repeat domain-containing protein [Myxococcales bacterium]|nr:HEAT repeat domain-containing protein [Myxococcales bacterium]